MKSTRTVAIVGGTGFVGSAAAEAVAARGGAVRLVRAPRLPAVALRWNQEQLSECAETLSASLIGVDALVNAAGNPDASARNADELMTANGLLPGVVARAATLAGIKRAVHVSSAVVQGRKTVLDETLTVEPFSMYAASKIEGELSFLRFHPAGGVVYRPPSVHAASRRISRALSATARSPLATVASPGDYPTPQALAPNVGDAIAFLALTDALPPQVVIHPWEGLSVEELLSILGGRIPRRLPRSLASKTLGLLSSASVTIPVLRANVRRLELMWFGQQQATSWLTSQGWVPRVGREGWRRLAEELRSTDATSDHSSMPPL